VGSGLAYNRNKVPRGSVPTVRVVHGLR